MRFFNALLRAVSAAGISQLLTRLSKPFIANPLSLSVSRFQNPAFTIKYYDGPRLVNTDADPNPMLLLGGTPSSESHSSLNFTINSRPVNKEYLWDLSGFFEVPEVCRDCQSTEVVFRVSGAREAYLQFGYRRGYPHLKMDGLEEMLEPQLYDVRDTEVRFTVQKGMFYPIRIGLVAGENTVRIWRKFGREERLLKEVFPRTSSRNMDTPMNEFTPTRDFLIVLDLERSTFKFKAYPASAPEDRDKIFKLLYGELSQKELFAGHVEPAFSGVGVRLRCVPGALEITGFFRVPETGCYTFLLSGKPLSVLHIGVGNTRRSNSYEMTEGWRVLDMRVSATDVFHLLSRFYYPFRVAVLGHEENDPWEISQWDPRGNSLDVLGLSGNPAVPYSEGYDRMNEWDVPGISAGIETYAHCEIYDEWSARQNEEYTRNMDPSRDDRYRQYPENPQTEVEVVTHEIPAPEVAQKYTEAPERQGVPPDTPDNEENHDGYYPDFNERYRSDTPEFNPSVSRYPEDTTVSSAEMGNDPDTLPETNHFDPQHLHSFKDKSQMPKHVLYEKENPDAELFERKKVPPSPPDVSPLSGNDDFPTYDKDIDQGPKKDDGLPEYSLRLYENYMENDVAKDLNKEKQNPRDEDMEDMRGWISDQPMSDPPALEQLGDDNMRDDDNESNTAQVKANSKTPEFPKTDVANEEESKSVKMVEPIDNLSGPLKSDLKRDPLISVPQVDSLVILAAISAPAKVENQEAHKSEVKTDAAGPSLQLKSPKSVIQPTASQGKDPKDNQPSILDESMGNRAYVSSLKSNSEITVSLVNFTEPKQKTEAELIHQQNVTQAIHLVVEEAANTIQEDNETNKEMKTRGERVGVPDSLYSENPDENTSAVIAESVSGKNVSKIMVPAVTTQNDSDDRGPEILMIGFNSSLPDATGYPRDLNSTIRDEENPAKHVADARNQVNPMVELVFSGSPSPAHTTGSNHTSELDPIFSAAQVVPKNRQIQLSNKPTTRNSSKPSITESHQSVNRILENAVALLPEVKKFENMSQESKSELQNSTSSLNVTEVYLDPKDDTSATLSDGVNGTNPVQLYQNPDENRGSNLTSRVCFDPELLDDEANIAMESLDFTNEVAVLNNADTEVGSNHTKLMGLPNENLHLSNSSWVNADYNNSIVDATFDPFDADPIVGLLDLSAGVTEPLSIDKDNHSQVLSEKPVNNSRLADIILSDSNSALLKTVASVPKTKAYDQKPKVSRIESPKNRETKYVRIPENCTEKQRYAANPHDLEQNYKDGVFIEPFFTSDPAMHSDTLNARMHHLKEGPSQRTRHYRAVSDKNATKDHLGPAEHSLVRDALWGSPLPDFGPFPGYENNVSTSKAIPQNSTVDVLRILKSVPCLSTKVDRSAHSNLALPMGLESSPVNTSKFPSREEPSGPISRPTDSGFEGTHFYPSRAPAVSTSVKAWSTVNASYIDESTQARSKSWDDDLSLSNPEGLPQIQEELFLMNEVNGTANIKDRYMGMNHGKPNSHSRFDNTQSKLAHAKTVLQEKEEEDHVASMKSWRLKNNLKEEDTLKAGRSVTPLIDAAPPRSVGTAQGRLALLMICVGFIL